MNCIYLQTNCAITEWEEKENKYPYILAFGHSKTKVTHYMIELEREFIAVSNFNNHHYVQNMIQ